MIELNLSDAIIIGLILGWFANWSLTAYFHRMCTHRSIRIKEPLLTIIRIYTWMTQFGITAPAWVGMHVMHHRYEDTERDPHSPVVIGKLRGFLLRSWGREYLDQYPKAYIEGIKRCPWDNMERFFARYNELGYVIFMLICLTLFGSIGLIIWSIVLFSTIIGNGIIASVAHFFGLRYTTVTSARNVPFFFFFLAGEEWHNNHHATPNKANFGGNRWWEIDSGYCLIWLFSKINLIKIN